MSGVEVAGTEGGVFQSIFPWDEAMRVGFGSLKLCSGDFWSMTPREFEAAVYGLYGLYGQDPGRSVPERGALATLMSKYPDIKSEN